jgi:hypothetical protein
MYEGLHIEFSRHAIIRMDQRHLDRQDIIALIASPDQAADDPEHGGILLTKYLAEWDRILSVAVEEHTDTGVLLVKSVIWSQEP